VQDYNISTGSVVHSVLRLRGAGQFDLLNGAVLCFTATQDQAEEIANEEFVDRSEINTDTYGSRSGIEHRLLADGSIVYRRFLPYGVAGADERLSLRAGDMEGLQSQAGVDRFGHQDYTYCLANTCTETEMTHGVIFEDTQRNVTGHATDTQRNATTISKLKHHIVTAAPAFACLMSKGAHVGFRQGQGSFYAACDGEVSLHTLMQKHKLLSEHDMDIQSLMPTVQISQNMRSLLMVSPNVSDAPHSEMPRRYCSQVVAFLLAIRRYDEVNHHVRRCMTNALLVEWGTCPSVEPKI